MVNVVAGAPVVQMQGVLVGGKAAGAGGIGLAGAKHVEAEEGDGPGAQIDVGEEPVAFGSAFRFVLVDVLGSTEWAHAAGGIGGIVGSGRWGLDVAREEQVHAA